MNFNEVIYQIYPLGFFDAPRIHDENPVSRLKMMDKTWISHLKKLGVTAVLFNPIFESATHGYDTSDYFRVDSRLGTNTDFKNLCGALHQVGIKVILDGVFNHVGRAFGPFEDVLEKKWDSPYKDWFWINFEDCNNPDGLNYADWEGHHELVKLNLKNSEVTSYLFHAIDSWVEEFGIDGLRLDVAYCLEEDFLKSLRTHVNTINPDFYLIGEVIHGDYNRIMNDVMCHSVTNYECYKGLYSSFNSKNLFEIGYALNRQFGNDPWCLYTGKHLMNFADNHDVNRIASQLTDKNDLPLLYGLLTAMPGFPCYYYGSEWGAEGMRTDLDDSMLRPYFKSPVWSELTETVAAYNAMRTSHSVFSNGNYRELLKRNEQWGFVRENEKETLLFLINIGDYDAPVEFERPFEEGINLMSEEPVQITESMVLPQKSVLFIARNR